MTGFLLELLYPTGWRRSGELYWRLGDCIAAGEEALDDGARGYRCLPAVIQAEAASERLMPTEAARGN